MTAPPTQPVLPLGDKPYGCRFCGQRLNAGQVHYARHNGQFVPLCPPCYQQKNQEGA